MIIFIETTFSHKYGFQRESHKIKNTVYHIESDDATVFTQWKGLFTGNIVNDPVSPKLTSTQTSYYGLRILTPLARQSANVNIFLSVLL